MRIKQLLIGSLSWKRVIRSIILIPVVVYIGLFIIGYWFADYVLFRPPHSYSDGDTGIFKLINHRAQLITARFYEHPDATYTILFSHGNAEDTGTIAPFAAELSKAGFNVLIYDYRGYGTSDGLATEQNTYEDAETAYNYLVQARGIPPSKIILHGRSLGGGPTMELASKHPVAGIILESTFTSAFAVPFNVRILPFDQYPNLEKMTRVTSPVLVIHGTRDRTISVSHGVRLYNSAPGKKFSMWVDDAGHNDLFYKTRTRYLDTIRDFADNLAK